MAKVKTTEYHKNYAQVDLNDNVLLNLFILLVRKKDFSSSLCQQSGSVRRLRNPV